MAHVAPLSPDEIPEDLKPMLAMAEARMGFIPNSLLTMARWPDLVRGFMPLVATVLGGGGVLEPGLKQMIAAVVSSAAGCRYCQAHTTHGSTEKMGVAEEKVAKVWEYRTSDLFSEAEKAALDLALAAGQSPNAATDAHFAALRAHFDERAIIEIVAVISAFGFLNRWNDTMATTLEDAPREFAEALMAPAGWAVGKHAADG
ncbi:carboxymuconolactone decarboxylase family protein [Parasphingopyxis algicola]|uniref:carboxymuconolactone decarboxylase family protein n=1 Tax=Parasphingopyxis algicola TaxID=2026624 RepID=UPI0015A184C9|nr:carboxymuconolactone decarboxylase family protein [Parasphingopyxis algicola]QLC26088.1 carboxymuconolactone decarboxylase family protein [Parasphingopyxis algicola]